MKRFLLYTSREAPFESSDTMADVPSFTKDFLNTKYSVQPIGHFSKTSHLEPKITYNIVK